MPYTSPLYNMSQAPTWAYAVPGITQGISQYFAGRDSAKKNAILKQGTLADIMLKGQQANKAGQEARLIGDKYSARQGLGDAITMNNRITSGKAPYQTPEDSGQFFRQTQQQQDVNYPGAYGDSLATMIRADPANFRNMTQGMGDIQSQAQQREVYADPNMPMIARGNLAYGKTASSPYSMGSSGQTLNQYSGAVGQTPVSGSVVRKNNASARTAGNSMPNYIVKSLEDLQFTEDGKPIENFLTGEQRTTYNVDLANKFMLYKDANNLDWNDALISFIKSGQYAGGKAQAQLPPEPPQEPGFMERLFGHQMYEYLGGEETFASPQDAYRAGKKPGEIIKTTDGRSFRLP